METLITETLEEQKQEETVETLITETLEEQKQEETVETFTVHNMNKPTDTTRRTIYIVNHKEIHTKR